MLNKMIIILIFVVISSGCTPDNKNSESNSQDIADLKEQISSLQSQVTILKDQIDQFSNKNFAIFTPGSKGYTTIQSDVGYFVVSLEGLSKYANGYKATFNIGNPNLMTFSGITVKVRWGEAYTGDKNIKDWINSLKSEQVEINKPLLPGVWNKISVVLSPAIANETGFIYLSIETNKIYLSHDLRKRNS